MRKIFSSPITPPHSPRALRRRRMRSLMGKKRLATLNKIALCSQRVRKTKPREVAPDAELGYNNGCIVDEYKGFSSKYTEPVVLVSYKEPLPKGFEDKQDEIVPVRIIAEKEPKKLIAHLVDLLSSGRGSIVL
ncbi:hypothetical protein Y032_0025g1211 [Ancylostoma ceylanicum]|nr:hypothetical protein Y032_0025g1211 [Ancylostoma ceylanicum]